MHCTCAAHMCMCVYTSICIRLELQRIYNTHIQILVSALSVLITALNCVCETGWGIWMWLFWWIWTSRWWSHLWRWLYKFIFYMCINITLRAYYKDIDECAQGTVECSQECWNTNGSYICTCSDGYQTRHDDPTLCVGIMIYTPYTPT